MALRVRGETVDEITGAVSDHARQDDAGRGARRRDRHRRHRRRCVGLLQHLDLRGLHRRRRRRAGRQARQPRAVVEVRRGRRAGALGVKIDLRPDEITRCIDEAGIGFMFAPAHHPAMKHVGADARRARHPHDLQPARPALQSGRRQAPDARRVLAAMGRAAGAGAASNLGSERVWVVHGSDGLDEITTSGPDACRGARERRRSAPSRSRRRTSGLPRAKPEALQGRRCRQPMPRRCAPCSTAQQGRLSRHRAPECRGRADRRRQGQGS